MYSKQTVEVQGSAMDILVFEAEGDGPHPGLVVAQHLPVAHEGLEKDPFTIDIGERLAAAGYATVFPTCSTGGRRKKTSPSSANNFATTGLWRSR